MTQQTKHNLAALHHPSQPRRLNTYHPRLPNRLANLPWLRACDHLSRLFPIQYPSPNQIQIGARNQKKNGEKNDKRMGTATMYSAMWELRATNGAAVMKASFFADFTCLTAPEMWVLYLTFRVRP